MKILFRIVFTCCALFLYEAAIAQNTKRIPSDTATADTTSGKHRYVLIGIDMGNNFSYQDRTDQSTYPYIYPNATYHAKSGYFASAGAFRVSNVDKDYGIKPWVELDLGTGWKFDLGENADLGLSYMYSAYNRNFPILGSALSNDVNAFYAYDFSWLYSKISMDYAFGRLGGDSVVTTRRVGKKGKKKVEKATFFNSHDVFMKLTLSHEFSRDDVFKDGDDISFEPAIYIEPGTNNFYNDYYKHNKAVKKVLKKGQAVTETDTLSDPYDANAASFKLREYVFSLPLSYSIHHFSISLEYEYIIPVNQPSDPNFAIKPYSLSTLSLTYKIRSK